MPSPASRGATLPTGAPLTAAGTPEAEARVRDDLDRIRSLVRRLVPSPPRAGLLLIGGFGRGEGAVLRDSGGELRAFNDYDLVIVTDGPVDPAPLHQAAPPLARELGVDFVDFGLVERRVLLGRPLRTIYAYEMREGHRVLDGPPDLLAGMPPIDPARLPLVEATRLLANRGFGLLWARLELLAAREEPGEFDAPRRRFTVNAIQKTVLALGEAALLRAGRYDLSYRERARRLSDCELPFPPEEGDRFRAAHAAATRFKLEPVLAPVAPEALLAEWERVRHWHERVFRWIEETRLHRTFSDWGAWGRLVSREALRDALTHPRRFLRGRHAAPAPASRAGRSFWMDDERDLRRRLAGLLYTTPCGSVDGTGSAWRAEARELLAEWHP